MQTIKKRATVRRNRAWRKAMAALALALGAPVVFLSGCGRFAERAAVTPALQQAEMAPCLYGQTVFYDGLAEERAMVKAKSARAKTGVEKNESNALADLLKQKEAVVSDLTNHLAQMTGKTFSETNVLPATGIILTRADSTNLPAELARRLEGMGREAFLIHSEKSQRIWIVANDRRGLSHGVYYYLEQLGVRWLMAGKNWTVIPRRPSIAVNIDRLMEPSFINRSYGSAVFGIRWGRKYNGSAETLDDWGVWSRRMRNSGMTVGKAVGELFVNLNQEVLQQHPDYLAKIDGKFTPLFVPSTNSWVANWVRDANNTNHFVRAAKPGTGTHQLHEIAKLNAGNPAAVEFFGEWILSGLRSAKAGPDGNAVKTVSVEPSDGFGEGNNYEELKAQGVGDGSESDQEFFIGNAVARKVRAEFSDVSVVMLAYAARSDPPSFALGPNFIVQPCFSRAGRKTARLSEDEWLAAWKAKTDPRPMATYDYWSIPDWTRDQPTFNYLDLAKKLRRYYSFNIKMLHAETSYGGGAMGIGHYLGSHLMWDINQDEKALIEDWYDNAFGPAKAPMKRMMERWARHWHPISSELGESFRDIAEAEKLAADNPAVLARVDDYARYLQYLRLWCEYLNAPGVDRMCNVVEHLLDCNDSRMTYTCRTYDVYSFSQPLVYKPLLEEFHLAGNPKETNGPGWARVHPLSHEDVAGLIRGGLSTYALPDFDARVYTGKSVSVNRALPNVKANEWGESMILAVATMELQLPSGLTAFPLRVSRNHATHVTVTDAAGKTLFSHWVEAAGKDVRDTRGAPWDEMNIPLAPGHYQVGIDGGNLGNNLFQTWKEMPLTLRRFHILKESPSPRIYFYVPAGLRKIAIFFPQGVRAGGIEVPFFLPDGRRAKIEERDGGKLVVADVPTGMDGKVWSFQKLVQPYFPPEMLNIPQCFSLAPEVLMVPEDAVKPLLPK